MTVAEATPGIVGEIAAIDKRGSSARPHGRRRRGLRAVLIAFCAVVCVIELFPLVWMLGTALKPENAVFKEPPELLSKHLLFSNFVKAWDFAPFWRFFLNSFVVAVVGTALTVGVASLGAFAFSRLRYRGRDKIFFLYIATMAIPFDVLVIPEFLLVKDIGWANSLIALIIPPAFGAYGVFLMRQYMLTIPRELDEAARVDGASWIRVYLRVIMPLVTPAAALLAVFTFVSYWNSFLWPLIVISSENKATVPLGLDFFYGARTYYWNESMAGAAMSMVPSIIFVIALQRWFRKGLALSGFGGL